MDVTALAAIAYAIVLAGVIAFQFALALGAPWGVYAMGGAFPGRFPMRMRIAAVVQAVLLALTVPIVLARAGLLLPAWSEAAEWLIWVVVAVSSVSLVLNLVTPSAGEQRIWVPVASGMLISSLLVALTAA